MMRTTIGLGVTFLVIALIAGVLNVYPVAAISMDIARVLFFVFLVLAVLAFVGGYYFRDRSL